MNKINVLIVDDEPLARERVRSLLASDPDVDGIAEVGDGLRAVEAIESGSPDLVFLDIQMPELDGFGVIEAVGVEHMPVVIFVTAYDEHALRAFDAHALDYLLKPFDAGRFDEAVRRAKGRIEGDRSRDLQARIERLLREQSGTRPTPERLLVRSGGRVLFLGVDRIDWIEAAGNYVRLHVGADTHLIRATISHMARRLEPGRFARIHRSTIVNLDRVARLEPMDHGDLALFLRDGTELTLNRTYRTHVEQRMNEL